jgi:hypothetical protein
MGRRGQNPGGLELGQRARRNSPAGSLRLPLSLRTWVATAVAATMTVAVMLVAPIQLATNAASAATTPTTVTTCSAASPSTLADGSSLQPGACLNSPNNQYQLVMQTDSNLVLYYDRSAGSSDPLWASNTDHGTSYKGAYAKLQANGILQVVLPQTASQTAAVLWTSKVTDATSDTSLVLQNDGNLVIYSFSVPGNPAPVWSTGTNGNRTDLTTCNSTSPSTLGAGSYLEPGACLLSPDHDYEVTMQADGNLVLYYEPSGSALWASNTGVQGSYATLQTDGNLIVNSSSGLHWDAGSSAISSALALQDDGNLIVYGLSGAGAVFPAWSTGTQGNRGAELTPGQTLTSGQYLQSPNDQYQLQMGPDGVLVLVMMKPYPNDASPNGTYQCPIWTAPAQSISTSSYVTTPVPSSYAVFQTTGNFVVYPPTSTNAVSADIWQAGTYGKSVGSLVLQNDGNLVMYAPGGGSAIWSSGTNTNRGNIWCTGEVLQGSTSKATDLTNGNGNGSSMNPATDDSTQTIWSLVGGTTFKLTMQGDCDLVLTRITGSTAKVEWSSKSDHDTTAASSKYANCYAILLSNGQVQVVAPNDGSSGTVMWKSEKNPTTQPFTITSGTAIGPFYAFTPTTSGTGTFFIANQAGNQIYPGKSHVLKYVLKAIKILVKVAIKFG